MDETLEVVGIITGPLPLAGRFARLAARGLPAICLLLGIAVVRKEKLFATQALPFSRAFHDPVPPRYSSDMRRHKGRRATKTGKKIEELLKSLWVKKTKAKPKKRHFHPAEE
jgi:hypothetical protein